jgi:prepilin-type N-terminal cleavage/methylation domain-containing protein
MPKLKSFSLLEVMLAVAILAALAAITYVNLSPGQQTDKADKVAALNELTEAGKAVGFYAAANMSFPAEVAAGVKPGIGGFIDEDNMWPDGPFSGSVYDYDNFTGMTCVDSAASGSIQITLKNVPGRNPDGSNNWVWYYVVQGTGTPNCLSQPLSELGECINCGNFNPF